MATAREARAERLNERLRGAQRVNVAADDSFNLDIADLAGPDTSPQQQQSSPAKRRKLDNGTSAPAAGNKPPASAVRRSPRTRDPYSLPVISKESDGQNIPPATTRSPRTTRQQTSSPTVVRPASAVKPTAAPTANIPDELESSPTRPPTAQSTASSRRRRVEEIPESPVKAPSSGRRRTTGASSALASSAKLQDALRDDDSAPPSSSPAARASRRRSQIAPSALAASARSAASRSPVTAADILSSDRPDEVEVPDEGVSRDAAGSEEPADDEGEDATQPSEEEAEPIGETEAAATLGRKRPRETRTTSPQLGSRDHEAEEPAPAPKRKRGRPSRSPASQRQGGPKSKPKTQKRLSQGPGRPRKNKKVSPKPRRTSQERNTAIELTVQRFVNHKQRRGDDEDKDGDDPLQLDIPFANRSGESAIDVFAQICDEVIGNTLEQFQTVEAAATDPAKKKELRIKMKAVEAYREVLNSRFLQQTIHLNHWHSLRKRIRHVQKEKLALREEIIRLKAEREQVALRMDAVRSKHETNTKQSAFLLETSTTMRDIDLAIAQGRDAPELSAKAQKEAELANLELAVNQVCDQASSASPGGGLLTQIKDFNGLLERTALTLESR